MLHRSPVSSRSKRSSPALLGDPDGAVDGDGLVGDAVGALVAGPADGDADDRREEKGRANHAALRAGHPEDLEDVRMERTVSSSTAYLPPCICSTVQSAAGWLTCSRLVESRYKLEMEKKFRREKAEALQKAGRRASITVRTTSYH